MTPVPGSPEMGRRCKESLGLEYNFGAGMSKVYVEEEQKFVKK